MWDVLCGVVPIIGEHQHPNLAPIMQLSGGGTNSKTILAEWKSSAGEQIESAGDCQVCDGTVSR